ncbi:fungal trichothecene efflux pump [Echria macrotheca]|uniref:Fungal trichothecene efflux pump n=1 Tax=Echria macrotheca TaxID=438768 RepID=A0AAJ0BHQ1_9PEZI|nr:fungal trichothecene efflux pump [Echria macrotheca]
MWAGAQAPLYFFAAVPAYIIADLGGADHWVWFVTANLLATAAISPFVGALSDLVGRRSVALIGSMAIIIGQVMCGAAQEMDVFIGGMAVSGIGTGICELTVLAGVSELVPISRRGYYLAAVTLSIIPFLPSVLFAQLIASNSSWRYIAVLTAGTAGLALAMAFVFYSPPLPIEHQERERGDKFGLIKRMDFVGGFLSIAGVAGIEIGLLGGGYQFPWTSAGVLAPLIVGAVLILCFIAWEIWGTAYPMIPKRVGKAPRTLLLTMVITFISGANFFAVIMIWPSQAYNVYGHDPIGVGIRGLPFAFGTLAGCIVSLVLLSVLRGNIKWILFGASILMTAGCGGMAAARVDNINTVYGLLFLAGLGVGGIVVPASMVTTYICPQDLIATITSLTITIRIIGGAVGYAVYYNVFANKLVPQLTKLVGGACVQAGITDEKMIGTIIKLTASSLTEKIRTLPGVDDAAWLKIVAAGQQAFANAYPWVYFCSLAFGCVAVIASSFLGDISEFVDDRVVVPI